LLVTFERAGSFTSFSDPDGNTWTLQQLPPRGSYDDVPTA